MFKLSFKGIVLLAWTVVIMLAMVPLASAAMTNAKLKAEAQHITDSLSSGNYDGARKMFNSEMKSSLSARQLGEAWQALVEEFGPFKDLGQVKFSQTDTYRTVDQAMSFGDYSFIQRTSFGPDDLVAGLYFLPSRGATAN